jgi:hypothetical protein
MYKPENQTQYKIGGFKTSQNSSITSANAHGEEFHIHVKLG